MRHLLEKKNELIHRSRKLRNDRALEIERKVKDYRANLEAEKIEGLDELDEIIRALDKVVEYYSEDAAEDDAEEVVVDGIEETTEAMAKSSVEEATRAKFDFGRPGVHTIMTPKR